MVHCFGLYIIHKHFTDWVEEKNKVQFLDTELVTALMPNKHVDNVSK